MTQKRAIFFGGVLVFAYLACASTLAALLLLLADAREGSWLNASAAALQVHYARHTGRAGRRARTHAHTHTHTHMRRSRAF